MHIKGEDKKVSAEMLSFFKKHYVTNKCVCKNTFYVVNLERRDKNRPFIGNKDKLTSSALRVVKVKVSDIKKEKLGLRESKCD